jgi:Icc-related predicted phosphoesterase
MVIWHFSDTHGYHDLLNVPENIDIAIFSGDCSNFRDVYRSEQEILYFLEWYKSLNIRCKIMIAGNHDTALERKFISKQTLESSGIKYLENESIEIDGIKIWGSPYTPSFNDWSFNKKRDKLHDLWQTIPEDTNIVVTHGPPAAILDLSYNSKNLLEYCGCTALKKRMLNLEPRLHLFGHIHNCQEIINAGYTKLSNYKTIFSNGSVVTDGKFGKLTSHGNIFEI